VLTKELAMRSVIPLILSAATLAGCNATPPRQAGIAQVEAQNRLNKLLAGKVPGPPQSCLALYRSNDMIVIDDYTIAFRDGVNRVWINKPHGGCNMLAEGPYALVTHPVGGMGLCRGDIGQVVDTMSHSNVGSCVMGDFIPYVKAGR
jgi:hypothetical protein